MKRPRNSRRLLPAGAIAIGLLKQGSYQSQRVAANTNARRVKAREVREPNAVYWGCCTKMGADPDPFIRSQILRDASGFFGGLD
jgi:hypothetical protein